MSAKTDLKAWQNRRCGNCALWAKQAGKRALADHYYACTAPTPDISAFPAIAACFSVEISRTHMSRDDGRSSPCWEVIL